MSIQEFHYAFMLAMDRVSSLSNIDFNPEEIDAFLNEAQIQFVNKRTDPLGNRKLKGVESTQKRIDDLSTLIIKYPVQPSLTPVLDGGVYEVDLANLKYNYFHMLSTYVDAVTSPGCESQILLKFIQHDDVRELLKDPFNSPSYEFLPYNFGLSTNGGSQSIYIYPGTFQVKKVYVEYIKAPNKMSLGTYPSIDGIVYPPTTSDLPVSVHNELVDLATQIAALATESPEYIQLRNLKNNTNE